MLRSRFAPAALLATSFFVFVAGSSATFGQEREAAPAPASEEDRIRTALDEPTSLEVRDAPLRDLLPRLRELTQANVILDRKALEDNGLADDVLLSGAFRDISLRSVLNLLLRPLDLTWMVHDGALVITTYEETETTTTNRVYGVGDLITGAGENDYDADELITLIESIVVPDTWDTVGGPAAIDEFQETIVVAQTDYAHRLIENLLAALRKAIRLTNKDAEGPAGVSVRAGPEAESAILAALSRPVSLNLENTPLQELPALLESKLDVQAMLDRRALDEVGLAPGAPVSLNVENMRAEQALRRLLGQRELTWQVRDEMLIITTQEVAETSLEIRVYPVRDLETPPGDCDATVGLFPSDSLSSLITVIEGNVAPDTWDIVGGPGALEPLPGAGVIAVSQTIEVHQQIEKLLTDLRRKLAEPAPAAAQAPPDDSLKLVIYPIPLTDAEIEAATPGAAAPAGGLSGGAVPGPAIPGDELVALITELIEPESWTRKGAYIRAVPGRLLIRQTPAIHRQVNRLLIQLNLAFFPSPLDTGGMGGGMGGGGFGGGGFF